MAADELVLWKDTGDEAEHKQAYYVCPTVCKGPACVLLAGMKTEK